MDGNRFDDITRKLAADTSRRSLLKRTAVTVAALTGLGGASAADAARRPTPTPKPLTCSYPKVASGGQCVCPGGTTACGPDCCPDGQAACCDGGCCYGTCYGEELCCPTGQIVCNGVCLAPGQCCTNDQCGAGLVCAGNVCVCQATSSCATAGQNCGTFTDDCGTIHDCGFCTEPQTCGGGGTPGICGCTSTMSCEGRCGTLATECGAPLDCGDTCGPCQSCNQNSCQNVADGASCEDSACVEDALCISGVCSGGRTKICVEDVADRCNRSECDPELGCIKIPTNEGGACTNNPCTPGACRSGECTETEIECPPCQDCQNGACVPSDDGSSCGNGLHCLGGFCCNLPTLDGVAPTSPEVLLSCFATDSICCDESQGPCCPGTSRCCDFCTTATHPGGEVENYCCPEAQQCGEDCCWDTHTCIDGRGCVPNAQVCAGGVVCETDKCCGRTGDGSGTCCDTDEYCIGGACVPMTTVSCDSNGACNSAYPGGGNCVGLERSLSTGQITQLGTCYPSNFSFTTGFGSGGPTYGICAPTERPVAGQGCCRYPYYECVACSCSRTTVRRWGR